MSLLTRLRHQVKQQALSLPDVRTLLRVVDLLMEERDLLYGWYVHMIRCEECDGANLCPAGKRRYEQWENVARKSGELLNR